MHESDTTCAIPSGLARLACVLALCLTVLSCLAAPALAEEGGTADEPATTVEAVTADDAGDPTGETDAVETGTLRLRVYFTPFLDANGRSFESKFVKGPHPDSVTFEVTRSVAGGTSEHACQVTVDCTSAGKLVRGGYYEDAALPVADADGKAYSYTATLTSVPTGYNASRMSASNLALDTTHTGDAIGYYSFNMTMQTQAITFGKQWYTEDVYSRNYALQPRDYDVIYQLGGIPTTVRYRFMYSTWNEEDQAWSDWAILHTVQPTAEGYYEAANWSFDATNMTFPSDRYSNFPRYLKDEAGVVRPARYILYEYRLTYPGLQVTSDDVTSLPASTNLDALATEAFGKITSITSSTFAPTTAGAQAPVATSANVFNYHLPVKVITVRKVWDDDGNAYGTRPEDGASVSVTRNNVNTSGDAAKTATVALTGADATEADANTWVHAIYVPLYSNDGTTLSQYQVDEAGTATGYTKAVQRSSHATAEADEITITNTLNRYQVAFDANGGTGAMEALSLRYGQTAALTANGFARPGHTFAGWNTAADGTGTPYADQAQVTSLTERDGATITLYAQWVRDQATVRVSAHTSGDLADLTKAFDYLINCPDAAGLQVEATVTTQEADGTTTSATQALAFDSGGTARMSLASGQTASLALPTSTGQADVTTVSVLHPEGERYVADYAQVDGGEQQAGAATAKAAVGVLDTTTGAGPSFHFETRYLGVAETGVDDGPGPWGVLVAGMAAGFLAGLAAWCAWRVGGKGRV